MRRRSKGQKLFRDAEEWINLHDKQWIFSFDNVCDMLDINPDYMRRGLQNWKRKKLTEAGLAQAAIGLPGADKAYPDRSARPAQDRNSRP